MNLGEGEMELVYSNLICFMLFCDQPICACAHDVGLCSAKQRVPRISLLFSVECTDDYHHHYEVVLYFALSKSLELSCS